MRLLSKEKELLDSIPKYKAYKINKPLIPALALVQKEKDSIIKEKSNKLLLNEESKVDYDNK